MILHHQSLFICHPLVIIATSLIIIATKTSH